jgi:hypothetical protein
MPIPVRITLDSGVLLEDDSYQSSFSSFEVGVSKPRFNIYADGVLISPQINESLIHARIELRISGERNRKDAVDVTLSDELLKLQLLRLTELYGVEGPHVQISIDAFDCILAFSSGRVRGAMIRDRDFVEMDVSTHQPTGRRKTLRDVAHDLVIDLELNAGETFALIGDGKILWSSAQLVIDRSLHIEVVTESSAADVHFRQVLNLREGQNYWLPNSGDPPPASPYRGQSLRRATEEKLPSKLEISRHIDHLLGDLASMPAAALIALMFKEGHRLSSKPVGRYINLWFSTQAADEPLIPARLSIRRKETIYLRINIAPYDSRTILAEAQPFPSQDEIERAFPETHGKAVPLEITLFSSDFEIETNEQTKRVKLARDRSTKTVYFKVTPLNVGLTNIRVCVFYKNHLLQSLMVVATVAEEIKIAETFQQARVETTYTPDFSDVEDLSARGLWLGINQNTSGTHSLNIKGVKFALSRDLEAKIENALEQARSALHSISFDVEVDDEGQTKKTYRFDRDNLLRAANDDARLERFKNDLKKLALVGSNLYEAVFGSVPPAEEADQVLPLVRELKRLLRDPQIIQVTRLKHLEDIWPWALMYDSSFDYDQVKHVCLAYCGDNGHALPFAQGVKQCKHQRHDKTVVCPYGFWGFKHIIEQPFWHGSTAAAFAKLVLKVGLSAQPVLEMPLSTDLEKAEADHVETMKSHNFKPLVSFKDIEKALNPAYTPPPPDPHVVYFFCHGKYDSTLSPFLQIGNNEKLTPRDLSNWDFQWTNPRGLVFINGCHTVDLKPKDLSTIMAPFVKAYASGIIGTEITVHSSLACAFAEEFFKKLLPVGHAGEDVGTIIRDLRLELLMKYNPLGLVYTPYCSADLQFVKS